MGYGRPRWLPVVAVLLAAACDAKAPLPAPGSPPLRVATSANASATACSSHPAVYRPAEPETERNRIHSLLAFAIALADWQGDHPGHRGRNIAAVLVNPSGAPVCWARNTLERDNDSTAHAEVRLMTSFLRSSGQRSLKGFKIFTTLEPCAMCAGMMTMARVSAVVWGQADHGAGGVFERLALDSTERGGHCPYPLSTPSLGADLDVRTELEEGEARSPVKGTGYLATAEARRSFEKATAELKAFQPRYAENAPTLSAALALLAGLPAEPGPAPFTACGPASAQPAPSAPP